MPALVYRNYLNESHESSEQHTAKSAGEEIKQQEAVKPLQAAGKQLNLLSNLQKPK